MGSYTWLQRRKTGYYFRQRIPAELRYIIGKSEIVCSLETTDYRTAILRQIQKAAEVSALIYSARSGEYDNPDSEWIRASKMPRPNKQKQSDKPKLSEMYEKWNVVEIRPARTQREWKRAVRQFTELNGDKPIDLYELDDFLRYIEALKLIPKNLPKSYSRLTVPRLIELVHQGHLVKQADRDLSESAINKQMSAIKSVFGFAKRRRLISDSPVEGLQVFKRKKKKARTRNSFTQEQLQMLFGSDQFKQYAFDRCHRFWLPLLALFTGARMEELGQALVSDVSEHEGVSYIDINDEGQKEVKSESSVRKVPLHEELINCGFLDYVEARKATRDERIFPQLKRNKDGKYTPAYSKDFARFRKKVGVSDSKLHFIAFGTHSKTVQETAFRMSI